MTEHPERSKCDPHGNLLAWERNRERWAMISFDHYVDYSMCYSAWAYLPEPPAPPSLANMAVSAIVAGLRVVDDKDGKEGTVMRVVSNWQCDYHIICIHWDNGSQANKYREKFDHVRVKR